MTDWIIIMLFALSVGLNAFLIWYCRKVVLELYDVSQNIKVLTEEIISFDEHLKSVHELEVFYGDETLGSLMQHSTARECHNQICCFRRYPGEVLFI